MAYLFAWDAHNFHSAWRGGLYDHGWFEARSFVYAPVVAQVLWVFTLLPFDVFHAHWIGLALCALIYLVGLPVAGFVALLPPVIGDVQVGNIHLLLGAALVLASTVQPGTWAAIVLTKVTPGVGILWHVGRREWRALVIAITATTAMSATSFLLAPGLWFDWIQLLIESAGNVNPFPELAVVPLPRAVRVCIAAAITMVAARRAWRWLLPVAVFIALPATWIAGLSVLLASWRLRPTGEARWRLG